MADDGDEQPLAAEDQPEEDEPVNPEDEKEETDEAPAADETKDETSRPATAKEESELSSSSRQTSGKSRKSVSFGNEDSMVTGDKEQLIVDEDEDDEVAKKSRQNCCVAIIAGMWASREMLKDNKDQQLFVKITLRELMIYCIFMFIICYATFYPYSPYNYQLTSQVSQLFPTIPSTTNMDQFWTNFIGDITGVGGLYWEIWYNQGMPKNAYIDCPDGTLALGICSTSLPNRGLLFENKMLGLPRLRQLKVTNKSCSITPDFQNAIKVCYAPYDPAYEDKTDYIPDFRQYTSIDAWTYHTADELGGNSFKGEVTTYSGAGYTQNLHQGLKFRKNLLLNPNQAKLPS